MAEIAIIEYGVGNIQSVANAIRRLGYNPHIVSDGDHLFEKQYSHIVLPGVGAMGHALLKLNERGLSQALDQCVIQKGIPFLGICVGMQVMAETCEEFGEFKGLGWIPGRVRHMSLLGSKMCLPHVGWNTNENVSTSSKFIEISGKDAYFLHSCAYECDDEYVLAKAHYGISFPSMVGYDHICGVQFHPEKSSTIGEAVFRAFLATSPNGGVSCTSAD